MPTLTLKTDERFFEKVTDLARRLHLSKSELIRRAIADYEATIRRKELEEQMRKASMKVREANRKIEKEFESTLKDGLDDL
ncbi:ribbon-helix-helix protein, CopG family [Hydrogenimonas sp. SS33]|uniref:ribbon-helix-helix protein, CopG family n=1 Tax=Hydrogenimonas leucolamina TaxID=2954236 RepID=UPI00336C00ED